MMSWSNASPTVHHRIATVAAPRVARVFVLLLLSFVVGFVIDLRLGAPTGPDGSLAAVRQAGILRIAIDPTYPPFAMTDDGGALVGYEVDLAREIARRLGVAPEFVGVDVGGMLEGLIAGRFDVAIGGLVPAPEDVRRIAYTRPYFDAGLVVVVPTSLTSTDLSGRRLAIEVGSQADFRSAELSAKLGAPVLTRIMDLETLEGRLNDGRIDGAVVDAVLARQLAKRLPRLSVRGERLTHEKWAIALRWNDNALREAIDDAMLAMEDEGLLVQFEQRWLN